MNNIIIKLSNINEENIKQINKKWLEFSDEESEMNYRKNYINEPAGITLQFYSTADIEDKIQQIKSKLDTGKIIGDIDKYLEKNKDLFNIPEVGSCYLVPEELCWHTLEKIIQFTFFKKDFIISEYHIKLLIQERDKHRIITTKRYCRKCVEYANSLGFPLPVYQENKNAFGFIEYNDTLLYEENNKVFQFPKDTNQNIVIISKLDRIQ